MKHSLTVGRNETEYLLPSDFEFATLAERLPKPLRIGTDTTEGGSCAFYDTFDSRLRRNGMRLLHQNDRFKLVGGDGRELASLEAPGAAATLRPAEIEPGPLRDRVGPPCGIRVLIRSAQVESSRRIVPVLDDEAKTVVRLVAEHAAIADGPRADDPLRPRLYVLGVRGYDKERERVITVLERDLGLTAASETFEEELRARSESSPAALSADGHVELTPDLPADRAAVALSMPLLHAIEANLPGTLEDLDSEFLHDLRVSVRRTRSLQRELKKVFPPQELRRFRQEFKWLQQVTGPSRDLDVYLLEFDDFRESVPPAHRGDLEVLWVLLEEHRATEREAMDAALRSDRTTRLLRDWAAFLERLPASPVDDRPKAVTPIGDVAAKRIHKVYRQMVTMGQAIDDQSPHVALHDLRKKGKELRYLLEFFSPLFPGKVTKPMVKTLKALQDTLGRFQDREVQAALVRSLGSEVGARSGGAETLMAMGILIERLNEQQEQARAEFSERFAAFSSPEQRALVKKTFG